MANGIDGKAILVVEDEYFIASGLRRSLEERGASIVGPVGCLADGMPLAEQALDAAVLDVNLENERSFPIADRLLERGVPFLLLTGYDAWALPEQYQQMPRLAKPFTDNAVVTMLEELLRTPASAVGDIAR